MSETPLVEVVLHPPPWLPPSVLENIRPSLQEGADDLILQAGTRGYTYATESSTARWPEEPSVLIGFPNIVIDGEAETGQVTLGELATRIGM